MLFYLKSKSDISYWILDIRRALLVIRYSLFVRCAVCPLGCASLFVVRGCEQRSGRTVNVVNDRITNNAFQKQKREPKLPFQNNPALSHRDNAGLRIKR
jgi:hypothetical protein